MDNLYRSTPTASPGGDGAYSIDQSISFGNLLHGMWKRKLIMIGVFAIVMTAVVGWLSVAERTYTPEVRILVEGNENVFTQPQASQNQRATVDKNEVASQVQVLLSNDLAQQVAKHLDLAQYSEFGGAPKKDSLLTKLFKVLGIHNEPNAQSVQQRVIERYFEKLSVYPVLESRVIAVEFTSTDPELAAKVANAVAETYVLATRQLKFDAAKDAMKWLSGEIGRLRETVAKSEAAVEEFRARKGLFQADKTTLDAQELAGINSQIILASAARSEAQARAKSIREMLKSKGGVDASSDVLKSNVIQRLREQQVTLQRTVADLQSTYLPTHPRMTRLSAEIKNLSAQIRAEALKIVESLENEARIQAAREAELRAELAKLKTRTSTSNQDEITLRALEREAEANRNLLQTFLQRFTEASARQDISALPAGARIISRAQVLGKPTFPNTKPLFLMGLAGALVAAFLAAFIAEVLSLSPVPAGAVAAVRHEPALAPRTYPADAPDSAPAVAGSPQPGARPHEPELIIAEPDVKAPPPAAPRPMVPKALPQFGPVLAELPALNSEKLGLVPAGMSTVSDPTAEFSLGIRKICQQLREAGRQSGAKRYVWTCADDLEDKVPVLVNLARTFAQNGVKTVLVDTDFESDELAETFALKPGIGLSDLLSGRAAFTDAIVRDRASGVHVIRQGKALDAAQAQLASERMDYILNALDQAYDVVLINVAPMNEPAAHSVAPKAGFAVVFAEATKAGRQHGAEAIHLLETLGVQNRAGVTVQSNGVFDKLLSKYRRAA